MAFRSRLASIAKREALSCYHGFVMGEKPNLQPIVGLFPAWSLENWDAKWCAAFVYHCCVKAGLHLPARFEHESVESNFAGCGAWERWAALKGIYHGASAFDCDAGDIVLYDNIFENRERDHIGIVVKAENDCVYSAEGNVNNISTVIKRGKENVRGYIRIPNGYGRRKLITASCG